MNTFDIFESALTGACLIEASAGTGKTHTITGLLIRLLLEKGLPIERILVVTFTEAATAELKSRIRERLRAARSALISGQAEDRFLSTLVARHGGDPQAGQRLDDAIRGFDQAAIFTIHGFCLRMLGEHAFETGFLFDTELSTDTEKLELEVADDYWRRQVYPAPPLFVNYLLNRRITPEALLKPLARHLIHPRLRIAPQVEPPPTSALERAFEAALAAAADAWQAERETVIDILLKDDRLKRNIYRPSKVEQAIARMEMLSRHRPKDPDLFADFDLLTHTAVINGTKKNQTPPELPFFKCCEELAQCREHLLNGYHQRLTALKIGLLNYLRKELERRKQEKNIRGFDDLLSHLHQVLATDRGAELAAAIRRTYSAALIDEFQDTDLLQYSIFNRIFNHENSLLFLIGDPKQAIYSFRGADIFAYLEAAGKVQARYTLKENWRSDPGLIKALNTVFQRPAFPFVYEGIGFEPAIAPANRQEFEILLEEGRSEAPLRLWFLDACPDTKPMAKAVARERIVRALAQEIARLLLLSQKGRITLGDRPLSPGHMAVLVRRNDEAGQVKEALAGLNIPAVVYNSGNIFETEEALEIELLLRGILFPDNTRALKAAMTTTLFGLSGDELSRMEENESLWEERVTAFKTYHEIWQREGFIRMFRRLLRSEKMLLRLMGFPNGERRNTNLAQLMEILHQESLLHKNSMEGLLQWFARRRGSGTIEKEEHQLRLESDAHAVKLITMHKSKGLEFPIVFCPFTWDGSTLGRAADSFTFHDPDQGNDLVLDLGSDNAAAGRSVAEREILAENLRLFYVALTRAKNRCYLVWGRFSDSQTSAAAYVLHHQEAGSAEEAMSASREKVQAGKTEILLGDLQGLERIAPDVIRIQRPPEQAHVPSFKPEAEKPATSCRLFTRTINRAFRIASFTSFVHRHPHAAEMADRDAVMLHSSPATDEFDGGSFSATDIFSFPKGAKPGTCLHAVFEKVDFTTTNDPSRIRAVVMEQLKAFCFDVAFEPAVTRMVQNVLSVPLLPGRSDLRLERISAEDRLNELEFYFPLRFIRPQGLRRIFDRFGRGKLSERALERMGQLDSNEIRGFMKGFMDLVFRFQGRFFILDWKSNHLGNQPENYSMEGMTAAMENELYFLQYHIYTVALGRYLQTRLPDFEYDTHFGGVFYVFLRGVDPEKGPHWGVYHEKPDKDLIRELTAYLTVNDELHL